MYKRGIVEEVDAATARVRVKFLEEQGLVSGWLEVLQTSTLGDRDYALPPKGCQVAVLLDDAEEAGCVLGAVYSQTDPPPATVATKRVVQFADGCRVEYDQAAHRLTVTVPEGGMIELSGTDPVALDSLVQSELSRLWADHTAHIHTAGTGPGGFTGAPVAGTYSVGPVGAAKITGG